MTERELAETICAQGGRLYRVGGCVRDTLLGLTPKDVDFCVTGMVKKHFKELFPAAKECGKAFPVFLLTLDGKKAEVAFARTERKVAAGYCGFKVSCKPKVTIEDDLYRRDTTVNSMAQDCLSGEIIDPYGGREDLSRKLLRATSEHFSEDPIRALRLAGQAARLGFKVEPGTLVMAAKVADELKGEAPERMLAEMSKALQEATAPASFFKVLAETGLLQVTFNELAQLDSSRFEAALQLLDATAKRSSSPKVRFASLGFTLSRQALQAWNLRMTLPGDWLEGALTAGEVKTLLAEPSAAKLVVALTRLGRGNLDAADFDCIAQAAALGLPELTLLKKMLQTVDRTAMPPELRGREIGQWLQARQEEMLVAWLQKNQIAAQ